MNGTVSQAGRVVVSVQAFQDCKVAILAAGQGAATFGRTAHGCILGKGERFPEGNLRPPGVG